MVISIYVVGIDTKGLKWLEPPMIPVAAREMRRRDTSLVNLDRHSRSKGYKPADYRL